MLPIITGCTSLLVCGHDPVLTGVRRRAAVSGPEIGARSGTSPASDDVNARQFFSWLNSRPSRSPQATTAQQRRADVPTLPLVYGTMT